MTKEEIIRMARWKQILTYPQYEVSDCGLVRRGNKTLSQSPNVNGYPRVSMSINGKSVTRLVHALVMEAFVGPRPEGLQIRHIDGSKTNNAVKNLAYCTPSENEADKFIHGTKSVGDKNGMRTKPESRPRGARHGKARLDETNVLHIKKQLSFGIRGTAAKLARQFGVSAQAISDIKSGRAWGHI
jgi:hypothetical protein